MIVKGAQRGRGAELASHLLRIDENEGADRRITGGVASIDVRGAIAELEGQTLATRARKGLFHAHISPTSPLSAGEWQGSWSIFESVQGLEGHAFVEVRHVKSGREEHRHRVYSRRDPITGKASHHALTRIKNELISRRLEIELGHPITRGRHDPTVIKWAEDRG